MSGIGFSELIILFLIGLIVLGPERLPRVANQLGTWLGQARRMTRVMKRQLEDELDIEKEPSIKPPYAATPPRDDDAYSPVHAAEQASAAPESQAAEPDNAEAAEESAEEKRA